MTQTATRNPFAIRDFRLLWIGEAVLGSVGLVPVSMLIAGAAVQVSLDAVFVVGGVGMAVLCVVTLLSSTVRRMGLVPMYEAPADGAIPGDDAAADPNIAGAPA